MYSFTDKGDRELTLRPEGTAPVVRAYLEHGLAREPQPVKLWYFTPMFRYAQGQRGRYREHWQFGVESLGSDDPAVDAEVIALQAAWYRELGLLDGLELELNSIGDSACRPAYRELLVAYLERFRGELSADSRARLDINPLRIFDSKDEGDRKIVQDAPRITDHLCSELRRALRGRALVPRGAPASPIASPPSSCAASTTTSAPRGSGSSPAVELAGRDDLAAAGATTASPSRSAASACPASASAAAPSASCSRSRTPASSRRSPSWTGSPPATTPPRGRRCTAWPRPRARRGLACQVDLAGRSLKGQLRHAERLRARVVTVCRAGDGARGIVRHGETEIAFGDVVDYVERSVRER